MQIFGKAARPPMLSCLLGALLLIALPACTSTTAFREAIPDEQGFDGAVKVSKIVRDWGSGVVTADVPYRDVAGNMKMGQARLILSKRDLDSHRPLPVFFHAHYEKSVNDAKSWCREGWAVATAHYKEGDEGYPIDVSIGDGFNLARAILEWVRRLPFIDRTHLHIDGGSQGGYMALAMTADFFPVSATTADVPVLNWAYNLSYFEANRAVSKWPQTDMKNSPLPYACVVTVLNEWSYKVFGNDLRSDTWYRLSPISYLDAITNPVLMVCATGDMLVPMEQVSRTRFKPYDPATFPEGFQRDFDTVTVCDAARKTFEELLPPEGVCFNTLPLQDHSFELTLAISTGQEKKPLLRPSQVERPWSDDHLWSVCILDEGPPAPYAGHNRYEWNTTPRSFVNAHRERVPAPEILTAAKLERLLRRYTGEILNPPRLADGNPANRLNFAPLERWDVVEGLLDYAGLGEAHAARLKTLYASGAVKPFGDALDLEALRNECETTRPGRTKAAS